MKKVLMILVAYPPRNVIGTIRNLNFARHLKTYGYEPIVITEPWSNEDFPLSSPTDIKTYRIKKEYISSLAQSDIRKKKIFKNVIVQRTIQLIKFLKKEFLVYPDDNIRDRDEYLRLCREIIQKEEPDMIFSGALPVTAHLIASELSKEFSLPWIADFRDLWTQNPYHKHTRIRNAIERRLELKTMKNAFAMVTVSKPLAEDLEIFHGIKTYVVTNGFEPKDYKNNVVSSKDKFVILYTGQLYGGKRNPHPIFKALDELVEEQKIVPKKIAMRFFGVYDSEQPNLKKYQNIKEVVEFKPKVNYKESIELQQKATVLLQLNSKSKYDKGVYTGKLFEYLGAKRPILAVPRNEGVVDELLAETNAGIVLDTVREIKDWLEEAFNKYIESGKLDYEGNENVKKYIRQEKAKELSEIFNKIN